MSGGTGLDGFGIVARVRRQQRRERLVRRLAPVAAALLLSVLVLSVIAVKRYLQSGHAQVHHKTVEGIDFAEVHRSLLPLWLIAQSEAAADSEVKRLWATSTFKQLRAAVEHDPELVRIVDELGVAAANLAANATRATPATQTAQAAQVTALGEAWNRRLDAVGGGYLVDARVIEFNKHECIYMNIYRVLTELRIPLPGQTSPSDSVGEAGAANSYRLRLLERADHLNGRELFLGRASRARDGALVIVDRVREFAVEDVWPLLDESVDADQPAQWRRFAPSVRAAVRAGLPIRGGSVNAFDSLRRTAGARTRIERVVAAVNARAVKCASKLRIEHIQWNGMSSEGLKSLREHAASESADKCGLMTPAEVEELAVATRVLATEPSLEDAVRALEAWLTRAVAIHELRHVTDDARNHGSEAPLTCAKCPEDLDAMARMELSAYLASFSSPDTSVVALYQASRVLAMYDESNPDSDDDGPSPIAALRIALPHLIPSGAFPSDFAATTARSAAALDHELFGSGAMTLTLPSFYPVTLPAPPSDPAE